MSLRWRELVALVVACSGVAGCWSVLDLLPDDNAAPPNDGVEATAPAPVRDAAADRSSDATDAGPPHRVFVTSTVHPGSSLASSPDTACNAAAAAAGLPGRFVAWLSFTSKPARDRLVEYGPWVTMLGRPVARDKSDLTKGSIEAPITHDERGKTFPPGRSTDLVWTGTDRNGRPTSSACADWSTSDGSARGTVGNATQSGAAWTEDPSATASCLSNFHVYCFEQPAP